MSKTKTNPMPQQENQLVEWKETWNDDYLRWVVGFANHLGGVLIIGKNDNGEVIGVKNSHKLLEDLPNKIRDLLGLIAEVHLIKQNSKDLIEIRVAPYPYPISYRGKYFLRTGSTLQELKGAALDLFLLKKQGKTWDEVPCPQFSIQHISAPVVQNFRQCALRSGRIDDSAANEESLVVLDKLRLHDGQYFKRAAFLVFGKDPEQVVMGAYVKIGFFRSQSDLVYHDEIHGDLFTQVRETLNILKFKYLKAVVSYDGIQRVETWPVPMEALREALLNALVHKDYSSHSPVQIRVYAHQLKIVNSALLPDDWNIDSLTQVSL
jgi:ATP-dependent DNA helicase RecG